MAPSNYRFEISLNWESVPFARQAVANNKRNRERVTMCAHWKRGLEPSYEAVSKHLCELLRVPAGAGKGLNLFIRTFRLS